MNKTKDLTPITTEYKGFKFRSRLEARWAVFFDAIGVKWLYEPEGFKLPNNSSYLPDFYLPDLNKYVEVKGILNSNDSKKVLTFDMYSDEYTKIVIVGDIPDETDDIVSWMYNQYKDGENFTSGSMDFPYLPCICPTCGKFGFEFDGRGARICRHDPLDDKGYTADHPRIKAAYRLARQARFEHGETPIIAHVKFESGEVPIAINIFS